MEVGYGCQCVEGRGRAEGFLEKRSTTTGYLNGKERVEESVRSKGSRGQVVCCACLLRLYLSQVGEVAVVSYLAFNNVQFNSMQLLLHNRSDKNLKI